MRESRNRAGMDIFQSALGAVKGNAAIGFNEVVEQIVELHRNRPFNAYWFGGEPLLRCELISEGMSFLDKAAKEETVNY